MTYKRFPHTATIGWRDAGTYSVVGDFTAGTLNTIWGYCNIQRSRVPNYRAGQSGDFIEKHFNVTWHRRLNTVFAADEDLVFQFNGTSYQVLSIDNLQKHTEIEI